VKSIGGFNVLPDYDIQSLPSDYEALILIGGMSWRTEDAKKIKPLVLQCLENKKIVGAICDASVFLGSLGVLNNSKHTSNEINDLKQWAGKEYTGEDNYIMEQAVSGNDIVTANGTATLEFAKLVMLALKIAPDEKIHEWYSFHKLGYYNAPMPNM